MRKILVSCALFFCALILHAHTPGDDPRQEFTRQINRQFATTANGMTVLDNSYGDVSIQTSPNAREVRVDVTITVKAGSKQEADRIFDAIQINFTHTPGYVKAQTVLQKKIPGGAGCKEFKVNYKVNMPADNQLELSNQYGNAQIAGALNGKLNAEIKYGDLTLDQHVNETQLLLGYGKLKAAKMGFVQGQLSYAQFDASQTGELRLESKYSKITVDRSDNVVLNSRYDDLKFGAVESVRIQAKYGTTAIREAQSAYLTAEYSDFDIRTLRDLLDADLSYGKLNIVSMSRDFKEARVNTRYTDVVIQIEPGAKFRFDTEGKHNKVSYPSAAFVNKRTDTGENSTLRGYVGDANSRRIVIARVDYGKFVIRQ